MPRGLLTVSFYCNGTEATQEGCEEVKAGCSQFRLSGPGESGHPYSYA
jgi:hypothetical protein